MTAITGPGPQDNTFDGGPPTTGADYLSISVCVWANEGRLDDERPSSCPPSLKTLAATESPDLTSDATDPPSDASDGVHDKVAPKSAAVAVPKKNRQPLITVYGEQWTWDPAVKDYTQVRGS